MSIQFRTRTKGIEVDPTTLSGACCSSSGSCTPTVMSNCTGTDSSFYPGQDCDPNPCVVGATTRSLYGVCCDSDGFCDITTKEGCDCRNGTWKGNDFDCLSYDCCADSLASHQACCRGNFVTGVSGEYSWSGVCEDLKPCECLNLGGVPRGALSTCTEINSAGGCGVTGATAYGSCCTTGNCLSPDDKEHPNGYTAGDCATLNGLWGGSGSACNDGTTFSNSWPCSWPTGSCCFGHHPFNGVTYCDSGKTCGDCLNDPPGGSGGLAWTSGVTCGTLTDINGIGCETPTGSAIGTCCIPEYFGVEDPSIKPFIVDYKCYVTTENRCITLGGLWDSKETDCEEINCCGEYGDCSYGDDGACCQFNINSGEFISCSDTSIYHCEQIASNNINITTLFHSNESCNKETGYPCRDAIFTTDSCCLWQKDGTYIGCQNIGEDDPCPPSDFHLGIRFDQPCQSPGFNCSTQEVGACCHDSNCSFMSRGQCSNIDGVFYEGMNCRDDCGIIPCCASNTTTVITGYNKDNESVLLDGVDGCVDSFSVPSHLDREFASDYLIDFGIDNPNAVYSAKNPNLNSCEDCDCQYSRNRGSCCWNGKCVPSRTQNECRQLGGAFQGCEGKPFDHISQSWKTENPCIDAGCSDPERATDPENCGENPDCIGACCSGDAKDRDAYCPPGGYCTDITRGECEASGRCFYGCGSACCQFAEPLTSLACCWQQNSSASSTVCIDLEDIFDGETAVQQCTELGSIEVSSVNLGYGTSCENLHILPDSLPGADGVCSSCYDGQVGKCCFVGTETDGNCIAPYGKNQCLWDGGCWIYGNAGCGEPLICNEWDGDVCIDWIDNPDYVNPCLINGSGVPTDCTVFQEEDTWPPSIWGSCCNAEDGTCTEMMEWVAMTQCHPGDPIGSSDLTWKQGTHCVDAGCNTCIPQNCSEPCPDCRPCCIAEGGDPAGTDEFTGKYLCQDMLPSDCEAMGGKPQHIGTKCSDFGIRISADDGSITDYNQGEYYCNYCGYKAHGFTKTLEDDSLIGATNLHSACTSCCGVGCETAPIGDCSCCTLPTRQDHFEAEQAINGSIPDPCGGVGPCVINIKLGEQCSRCGGDQVCHDSHGNFTYYNEQDWCTQCECSGLGACCLGCIDSASEDFPLSFKCMGDMTRDDCEDLGAWNDDSGEPLGQRGVWMGPGSECPYGRELLEDDDFDSYTCPDQNEHIVSCHQADGSYCESHQAPCCSCKPWPHHEDSLPDSWALDCPNGDPTVGGNCCEQGLGPGHGPPPWTGTYCTQYSLYDINAGACINRDNSPGYVGEYGTKCAKTWEGDADQPYGDKCRTCDLGTWGVGTCCSCHRWAFHYPHYSPNGEGGWDCDNSLEGWDGSQNNGIEHGQCGGFWSGGNSQGSCYVASKHECDLMNKYNNREGGTFMDFCPQWNGNPREIWKYPECNSYAGVHGVYGSPSDIWHGNGAQSEVLNWTWHGPNKPVSADYEPMTGAGLNECGQVGHLNHTGCNMIMDCSSAAHDYSDSYYYVYGQYSFCNGGTTPWTSSAKILAGSCGGGGGFWSNGGWSHSSLYREWSSPYCHPRFDTVCKRSEGGWGLFGNDDPTSDYEMKGTPLKDIYCSGAWARNEVGCGTGCQHCRVDFFPGGGPHFQMQHRVVSVGHYRTEEDCDKNCKPFGACCNPLQGTCARWPEYECLLLGGLYLGDFPCGSFGCPCDEYSPQEGEFTTPFPTYCVCNACSAFMPGFRDDTTDVKYETLLVGRDDNSSSQFATPFFGFVDVQTSPIDIPEDALPPIEDGKSILYWKISGDDASKSMMIDIPFPTDATSHQYIAGYVDEEAGHRNNKFYWGTSNVDTFKRYKESINQLWITRKYQTPENIELAHTFEPYYHSKVEFAQVPNLKKFVLNPARYGNGRNEFNEEQEWLDCTDMVGYYIGQYLAKDMINSGPRGSKVQTLIAEDSSIDSAICTPMQYLNTSQLRELNTLHVNNNDLYRLDINRDNNIRELFAEHNNLGAGRGTDWIDSDGYPNKQENFPMYRLDKIQRLILSHNDIKTLETQSIRFDALTSLIASNNKQMNNEDKLHLVAPFLEYLDLSGCGLGAGIVLESVGSLKQIILRDMINLGSTDDVSDGHFQFTLGRNKEMSNLEVLILTKSQLRFLNLGTSSQLGWGDSGVVGEYNEYGNKFLNLKYIDLNKNHRLSKILLPSPSEYFANSGKEYMEYVNVSETAIGENIDEFFSQSAILHPNSYPAGHSLEISARNITDLNGNKVTLSLDKYNEIVNNWDGSGKFIILDVDIDK